jgi:hypothetical protein
VRGWLPSFCLAVAILVLSTFVLPFHDFVIELEPDGTSLGTISVLECRIIAVTLGGLPLLVLAAGVELSRHLRLTTTPWKAVAAMLVIGLLLVGWLAMGIQRNWHEQIDVWHNLLPEIDKAKQR